MKDRAPKGNKRNRKYAYDTTGITDFNGLLSALTTGLYGDSEANNVVGDGVTEVGTPLNKSTLLTDSTADILGLIADADRVPDKAFLALFNRLIGKNKYSRTLEQFLKNEIVKEY